MKNLRENDFVKFKSNFTLRLPSIKYHFQVTPENTTKVPRGEETSLICANLLIRK